MKSFYYNYKVLFDQSGSWIFVNELAWNIIIVDFGNSLSTYFESCESDSAVKLIGYNKDSVCDNKKININFKSKNLFYCCLHSSGSNNNNNIFRKIKEKGWNDFDKMTLYYNFFLE